MAVTIEVKAREQNVRLERHALAQRVLDEFEQFPDLKLLAFFDDEDALFFRSRWGPANRAMFADAGAPTFEWPEYLTKLMYVYRSSYWVPDLVFDWVIYLHGTTCSDAIGLVMSFAHELQHAVQRGTRQMLHAENGLLYGLDEIKSYDIPIEREARIVAKHIAERVCGVDAVKQYILRRQGIRLTDEDAEDWKLIETLDSSQSYDLENETELAFQRLGLSRRIPSANDSGVPQ